MYGESPGERMSLVIIYFRPYLPTDLMHFICYILIYDGFCGVTFIFFKFCLDRENVPETRWDIW